MNRDFGSEFCLKWLRRLQSEATWAILNRKLMDELGGFGRQENPHEGVTRGEVVFTALDEDIRVRMAKLFDSTKGSHSFRKLVSTYSSEVQVAAAKVGVRVDELLAHGDNWTVPRNKTIAHIDEDSILAPGGIWSRQDISWEGVRECLDGVTQICDELHPDNIGIMVRPPEFPPGDPPLQIAYAIPPDPLEP